MELMTGGPPGVAGGEVVEVVVRDAAEPWVPE
jgi:hypothetical protein